MTPGKIKLNFRRNGYCILEGALTGAELDGLRSACEVLLAEKPVDGGGKFHDIGRGEARRFLRHRHEEFRDVESFVFGETMRGLATNLLGDTPYLFNEQFVVKGAGTGANFAWHQDGAYVGFDHKPYITVWIALDDTTEENGCVYLLPRNLDLDECLVPHRWDEGQQREGRLRGTRPRSACRSSGRFDRGVFLDHAPQLRRKYDRQGSARLSVPILRRADHRSGHWMRQTRD